MMSAGFSLYVHFPLCRTVCPYCDFAVVADPAFPEERYVDALVRELGHHASAGPFAGGTVRTIYLGGGTPSLFAVSSITRLLEAVRSRFAVERDAEITLEANPEAADVERLTGYRRAGVNRLSLGIQSFEPRFLKTLGRASTASETSSAPAAAREAGFDRLSLDLIFAIPGQTLEDWREDLDRAIATRPEHVSAYGLTYEAGTPFFTLKSRGRIRSCDEEVEASMFEEARRRLPAAGLEAYEISSFARPGHESRHNSSYWTGAPYLGLGASAHSHEPIGDRTRRSANERSPVRWLERIESEGTAVASEEILEPGRAAGEAAFLALRTAVGLSRTAFAARFGDEPEALLPQIPRLLEEGWLVRAADRIALTPGGLLVADAVFARLVA